MTRLLISMHIGDLVMRALLNSIYHQSKRIMPTMFSMIATLYKTAPLAMWAYDSICVDLCIVMLQGKKSRDSPSHPSFWANAEEQRNESVKDHEMKLESFGIVRSRNPTKEAPFEILSKEDVFNAIMNMNMEDEEEDEDEDAAPIFREPPTPSNNPFDNLDRASVYLLLYMVQSISNDGEDGTSLLKRIPQEKLREATVLLEYIKHQHIIGALDAILQTQIQTVLDIISDATRGMLVQIID